MSYDLVEMERISRACHPFQTEQLHPCHLAHLKKKQKNFQAVVAQAFQSNTSLPYLHRHQANALIHPLPKKLCQNYQMKGNRKK